ncbi:MAG: hypothetical protein JO314_05305 [Acidobacteria bacterium]|nr:hypothetical protein [Acidobacteriota bacterium]
MIRPSLIKTFFSPINEDNCTEHRFIGKAESTMRLQVDRTRTTGTIHWTYKFVDGEFEGVEETHQIFLFFDGQRVTNFDGVFELPEEAIELLESNGFDVCVAKEP